MSFTAVGAALNPQEPGQLVRRISISACTYSIIGATCQKGSVSYQQFKRRNSQSMVKQSLGHLEQLQKECQASQKALSMLGDSLQQIRQGNTQHPRDETSGLWELDKLLERINEDFQKQPIPVTSKAHDCSYGQLFNNIDKLNTNDTVMHSQDDSVRKYLQLEEGPFVSDNSLTVESSYQPSSKRARLLLGLASKASNILDKAVDALFVGWFGTPVK